MIHYRRGVRTVRLLACLFIMLISTSVVSTELQIGSNVQTDIEGPQVLEYFDIELSCSEPEVTQEGGSTTITIDDTKLIFIPTHPILPTRLISLYIPGRYMVTSVDILGVDTRGLGSDFTIEPASLPICPGCEPIASEKDDSIYASSDPYPSAVFEVLDIRKTMGYNLYQISLFPVTYYPVNGTLFFHPRIKIRVHLKLGEQIEREPPKSERDFIKTLVDNDFALDETYEAVIAPVEPTPPPGCGNGECDEGETSETCCLDCGCTDDLTCMDETCRLLDLGESCDQNAECESFYCSIVCTMLDDGEVCTYDRQCNSGQCVEGECARASRGEPCDRDEGCITRHCIDGTCTALPLGGPCLRDHECISYHCIKRSCVTLERGQPCLGDIECTSGMCRDKICFGLPVGTPCKDGSECGSYLCIGGECRSLDDGERCTRNEECTSVHCNRSICCRKGAECCETDDHCPDGMTCQSNACTVSSDLAETLRDTLRKDPAVGTRLQEMEGGGWLLSAPIFTETSDDVYRFSYEATKNGERVSITGTINLRTGDLEDVSLPEKEVPSGSGWTILIVLLVLAVSAVALMQMRSEEVAMDDYGEFPEGEGPALSEEYAEHR